MSLSSYEKEIIYPYSENEDLKVCSLLVLYGNNSYKKITKEKVKELQ